MAAITSYTQAKIEELVGALLETATIDVNGHLIFTTEAGGTIDAGPITSGLPFASTTTPGLIELAAASDITAGTDNSKAVTPSQLKGQVTTLNTAISGKQASDSDLTAIAAIAPADNDFMQRKSGAWTNRTPLQVCTDIDGQGYFMRARIYGGSTYGPAANGKTYVGTADPAATESVVNGSIWFDTSGS